MKFLKCLFNFYISLSIHVALSVYALVRITEFNFNLFYNESVNYFIFYATITGYNFVKYAEVTKLHYRSLTNNLKIVQFFSLICFILTIYYGFQLPLNTILMFIPFGLLTYLYTSPFLSLRNIPSIKIVIIAFVWAGVTVLIPIFNTNVSINFKVLLAFIQRFLFVVVLTLPFDIRDFRFDKKQLQTIPQLIGIERTKKFGFILMIIAMLIEFFITPNQSSKLIFIIVFLILLILLQRASVRQKKYYSSFWVEAIPVFWWILSSVIN